MRIFKRILMFCLMGMTLTAGLTGCSGKVEFVDEIPSEARKAVEVIEAVYRSAREGKTVKL